MATLLLSIAGIIAVWFIERPIEGLVIAVLESVHNSAQESRVFIDQVDEKLEQVFIITNDFSNELDRISQTEVGVREILSLLPEDNRQRLRETSESLKEIFESTKKVLSTGFVLYRSIDQLPLIDLPHPSEDQIDGAGQMLAKISELVNGLERNTNQIELGNIEGFKSLREGFHQLSEQIIASRSNLSLMDERLANLLRIADQYKRRLHLTIVLSSIVFSLLQIFIIYSQVEFIRVIIQRWHLLDGELKINRG